MKKIALLLGAAFMLGTATYACDGHKEKDGKGKKEACCAKDKKDVAGKEKGCCKKGEGKTATANDSKKVPTKEVKSTTTAAKKS